MLKTILAGATVLALVGATAVYAQSRYDRDSDDRAPYGRMNGPMMGGPMMGGQMMEGPMGGGMMWGGMGGRRFNRMSPDDMAAFTDARIAAVKAGLKLNPEQEKLWPPVEAAVRDFAKLRIARITAMRDAAQARQTNQPGDQTAFDPIAMLRTRADTMAETAAGLKRIAETADPLYKTLDNDQKRRLWALTRGGHGKGHWRMPWNRDGGWRGQQGPGPDRL